MCVVNKDKNTHIGSDTLKPQNQTATPRVENNPDLKPQIIDCQKAWIETVKHFYPSMDKVPKANDMAIARQIKAHGFENTRLAILGAKFEPKSENFDPAKHLKIERVFTQKMFDKFVLLGQASLDNKVESEPVIPCQPIRNSAESVSEFFKELGK